MLAIACMSFSPGPVYRANAAKRFTACFGNQLSLELRADNTFRYQNTTNSDHPLDVQGQWYFREGVIHLMPNRHKSAVPTTWKVDRDTKCLVTETKESGFMQLCG